MRYIVKCPICGIEYKIGREKLKLVFPCEVCGEQNSIDDIEAQIEKFSDQMREMEKERIRKENLRNAWKDDGDLKTIKSFSSADYPAIDKYEQALDRLLAYDGGD